MSVRALDKAKTEFLQRYSNREIFTLIFTDYKKYPSELTKIADLELVAKEKISQIVNALGIGQQLVTLQDLFTSVNQIRVVIPVDTETAAVDDTAGEPEPAAALDYTGGGG